MFIFNSGICRLDFGQRVSANKVNVRFPYSLILQSFRRLIVFVFFFFPSRTFPIHYISTISCLFALLNFYLVSFLILLGSVFHYVTFLLWFSEFLSGQNSLKSSFIALFVTSYSSKYFLHTLLIGFLSSQIPVCI